MKFLTNAACFITAYQHALGLIVGNCLVIAGYEDVENVVISQSAS